MNKKANQINGLTPSNRYFVNIWHTTRFGSLVILLLVVVSSLNAQNDQPSLSIPQAVERGLNNNFKLKISQINTKMADNQLDGAMRERLPRIEIGVHQGNKLVNDRSPTSFINRVYRDRNLAFGVDGDWVIFDGFQGKLDRERYKNLKIIKEGDEQLAMENSIYRTLLAYYNAALQKEAVEVAKQSLELSLERYKDADLQRNLGKASAYDVIRFENASLTDSAKVIAQQKELEEALISLNLEMGNKKNIFYDLIDPLSYVPQQYELATMLKQLDTSNKSLRNRYLNLEVLKLNTISTQRQGLPSLRLSSGLSKRFNGTLFPEEPRIKSNNFEFSFRFSATYNLFDGGAIKREVERSRLLEQVENLEIEQIKTNLSNNIASNVASYNRQLELIYINEQLIENLEKSIALEEDRYRNGFSSALDYRSVQVEYINAKFNRLETIFTLLRSEIEILRLTGALNRETLK